jgi:hypothetical protein
MRAKENKGEKEREKRKLFAPVPFYYCPGAISKKKKRRKRIVNNKMKELLQQMSDMSQTYFYPKYSFLFFRGKKL